MAEAPERILLVEDEALIRAVIGEDLRDAGFEVAEASSPQAAYDALSRRADFDLLLTDIRFGDPLTGWDVAERAREQIPAIRVVYMTGFTPVRPRLVPNSRLLMKPCTGSEVVEAIRSLRAT